MQVRGSSAHDTLRHPGHHLSELALQQRQAKNCVRPKVTSFTPIVLTHFTVFTDSCLTGCSRAGEAHVIQRVVFKEGFEAYPAPKRFFRCWTVPKQRRRPAVMMPMRVHSASHSSML